MEHIVQFGINIDDDAVKRAICANVEKVVIADIRKQIEEQLGFRDYSYRYGSRFVDGIVDVVLEEHLGEISDAVAAKIADRLCKRKSFTDAVVGKIGEAQ